MDIEPHAFRETTAVGGACYLCDEPRAAHDLMTDGFSIRLNPKKKGKKHWITSKSRDRQRGRDAKYWMAQD